MRTGLVEARSAAHDACLMLQVALAELLPLEVERAQSDPAHRAAVARLHALIDAAHEASGVLEVGA